MLIRTYRYPATGRCQESHELPEPGAWEEDDPSTVWWVDVEDATEEALDELAERLGMDPTTVEELRDDSHRAHIDSVDGYFHLLLYGVLGTVKGDAPQPRRISIICKRNIVLTIRDLPMGSVQHVAKRAKRIAGQVQKKGVGHLLFLLIDKLVDNNMLLAKQYEETLEQLEDRSVAIDCGDDLLEDLAEVRREVLELWRLSVAQREVLIELCEEEIDHLPEETQRSLERVRDHMTSSLEIIEILRGMVGDVRENYRTTVSLRGAEATQKLTVFAGLLLPLSVIAGFYGMNLPLWPDPSLASSFWLVLGAMGAVSAGLAYYFYRRNWL